MKRLHTGAQKKKRSAKLSKNGRAVAPSFPIEIVVSIPHQVLEAIAHLTGVPKVRYGEMRESVYKGVISTTTVHCMGRLQLSPSASQRRSLAHVAQAADELRRTLECLDERALWMLALRLAAEDGEWRWRRTTIRDYESQHTYLAGAARAAAARPSPQKRTVGSPTGPRNPGLYLFVQHLYNAIETVGGGRLTYDRKMKSGSLVAVLRLLRPHLVDGLIPECLPWRALENITPRKIAK